MVFDNLNRSDKQIAGDYSCHQVVVWRKKALLLLIMAFLLSTGIFAGNKKIYFKKLTVADGLSQNRITCMLMDHQGYMWFGSEINGIMKYDGYNIRIYKNDLKDRNTPSNNSSVVIYEDSYNNLWYGTAKGLNKYNRSLDVFQPQKAFKNYQISGIIETEDNRLIIAGVKIFALYNPVNDSIQILKSDNKGLFFWRDIQHLGNGKYLFTTYSDGLGVFDLNDLSFSRFRGSPSDSALIHNESFNDMYKDRKGRFWLASENHGLMFFEYNPETHAANPFTYFKHDPSDPHSIGKGPVLEINEDLENNLWILIDQGGIDRLDLKNCENDAYTFKHLKNNIQNKFSLSEDNVISLYHDRNGTTWVGTNSKGLNYYNDLMFKFDYVNKIQQGSNSYPTESITSFHEDDAHFWMGTPEGLIEFNKKANKWNYYVHDPLDESSIGENVCCLLKDSRNNFWVGTWDGGLNLFQEKTGTFYHYKKDPSDPHSNKTNNVFGLMEDKDGDIWISSMKDGLIRFNYETRTFTSYNETDDLKSISSDFVKITLQNSFGEIWVLTMNGVNIYDKKTDQFERILHDDDDSTSLSSNHVISIFEDSKRNLWIGAENGLNLYNRDKHNFTYYGEKAGLPNYVIKAINEDDHGNLWISTDKGISKFVNAVNRPENPVFLNYISDGIQSHEFSSRSTYKAEDGRLFFGGINGYNVFHPDSIEVKNISYNPILTNFLVFNKPVKIGAEGSPLARNLSETKEINLKYDQSVFTIEYATINYFSQSGVHFAYLLEGFETEWNYVGYKRSATYTNLDPGKYRFALKTIDNSGKWNDNAVYLYINITSPWWGTWYFKLAIGLLVLINIFMFYILRIHRIRISNQILEKKVEAKTADLVKTNNELKQFAYVVSHDLKAPLRGISSLAHWIEEDITNGYYSEIGTNLGLIKNRVSRMQNLINGILYYSRIGKLNNNKEKFNTHEVIKATIDALNINPGFSIHFTGKFPNIRYSRTLFEQVFTDLIDNSVKHHHKKEGNITISCIENTNFYIFSVKDDGPGILKEYHKKIFIMFQTLNPKDKFESTGMGLSVAKKIVEENNGTIWVESDGKTGSKFIFTIPK